MNFGKIFGNLIKQCNLPLCFAWHSPLAGGLLSPQRQLFLDGFRGSATQLVCGIDQHSVWFPHGFAGAITLIKIINLGDEFLEMTV